MQTQNTLKAIDVADAFLNKVPIEAAENYEGIHKVKLQKLLFFAQEEYLFRYERALFDEKIEAWQHGPVVREVWNKYAWTPQHIITQIPNRPNLSAEVEAVIDYVWSKYGEKDAWYLRDLSHSYEIWKTKRAEEYGGRGEITPDEILRYRKKCEKAKAEAADYIDKIAKDFIC